MPPTPLVDPSFSGILDPCRRGAVWEWNESTWAGSELDPFTLLFLIIWYVLRVDRDCAPRRVRIPHTFLFVSVSCRYIFFPGRVLLISSPDVRYTLCFLLERNRPIFVVITGLWEQIAAVRELRAQIYPRSSSCDRLARAPPSSNDFGFFGPKNGV